MCPNYQLLPQKCSIHYALLSATVCSAHYTALQVKNSCKIVSASSPFTTENMDDSHLQTYCREAMHRISMNRHLGLSAKRNGTQRRTKVSSLCIHCTHCGMPKGTSRDEVTSNREKIKPIVLAIIELRDIKQAVSQ